MSDKKKVVKKVVRKKARPESDGPDISASFKEAFSEMWVSVFLPAAKGLARDAFDTLVDGVGDTVKGVGSEMIGGGTRVYEPRGGRSESERRPRKDYTKHSRSSRGGQRFGRYDLKDVTFDDARDADVVVDEMYENLRSFGYVTVSEFYELAGLNPSHTDDDWGWTRLSKVQVRQKPNGEYYILLPRPRNLDEL